MKINFNFLKHLDRTVNYECIVCKRRLRECKFMYISDGYGICRSCVDELPFVPVGRLFDGTKNISYFLSVFYYVGIIPSLIADYKFRGCKSYANIFARFMNDLLLIYEEEYDFNLIVPVPLSKEHFEERGYNQSGILAELISENTGVPCRCDAIVKIKNTRRQSDLKSYERADNIKGAFSADKEIVNGRRILLIDDVVTTASTVNACAKELKRCGAEAVFVLSVARRYSPDRSQAYKELFGM